MNCIVTAGPTYEPLDNVRRLTNMSTGKLGSLLANFLVERGHQVTLLFGENATYHGEQRAQKMEIFGTTEDLKMRLHRLANFPTQAIFHAAAVNDFAFGKVYERRSNGALTELKAGKISTRQGELLAQLVPTPKIIPQLRGWFPSTLIVGWKYEVDGDQSSVLQKAAQQMAACQTNACVANGPAYGPGFGVVDAKGAHKQVPDRTELFIELERLIAKPGN